MASVFFFPRLLLAPPLICAPCPCGTYARFVTYVQPTTDVVDVEVEAGVLH